VPALSGRGAARKPPEHHQTLDPVLARAMAKNPDERFPTARALVEALRAASAGKKVITTAQKRSLTLPAVAGVSVLGLGLFGAFVIRDRGDDEAARERPDVSVPRSTSKIWLEVITRPQGAMVTRDGVRIGQTPLKTEVEAGPRSTLTITKAGYRSIGDSIAFDKPLSVTKDLQPIVGYEGVWAMPDGKLRGFSRTATDKIEVYRLESVTGSRELWRTCDLTAGPTDSDLVVFATTAEMTDERAHAGDAGCSNPHGIEYTFDPGAGTLAVRVERIETTSKHGHCEVVSKRWGAAHRLTRADRAGDTRFTEPPVGLPIKSSNNDAKVPSDTLDNKFDTGKPVFEARKPVVSKAPAKQIAPDLDNSPKKPPPRKPQQADPVPPTNAVPNAPAPQQQAPSKNEEPPIQKSQAPGSTPQAAIPPRGDSQAAK